MARLEADVIKEIQAHIIQHELGKRIVKICRQNSGLIRRTNGSYAGHAYTTYIQDDYWTSGEPDLSGVFSDGRFFVIEVKSPTGKLSYQQSKVMGFYRSHNIPCLVATSVKEVIEWLGREFNS